MTTPCAGSSPQRGSRRRSPLRTQADPDPDFPTVSFPNPEEAGAIDAALAVAREVHPDVVIANDPDADRCAAAVLDQGVWRMLRGDELGAILFEASMLRGLRPRRGGGLLDRLLPAAGGPRARTRDAATSRR